MDLSDVLLKFVVNQSVIKRDNFLLVDNTFNNDAELVDNFSLFEYLQSCPEYKNKSYYIINKKNINYKDIIKKYPHNIIPVKHGRINLLLLYRLIFAKYWLDSFQVISAFDTKAVIRAGVVTTVYTQHGVNFLKLGFIGDITISPKYFNKIIFSNKYEKEIFDKYYDYHPKNVIYSGLARWDLISADSKEKIIFAYFTSRVYFYNKNIDITKTRYYKNIIELLASKKLLTLLEKNNIKLYVGLHHEITRYNNLKQKMSQIHFVEDKDIGAIKQKASMLITDFSSMCFDFMVYDKPVVFFRVDAGDALCKTHPDSAENDINVESKNADLYNIFYEVTEVENAVEKYVKNNFNLETEYREKNKKFFTYRKNIRKHIIENLLSSPLNIENKLPLIKNKEKSSSLYLFGFIPLYSYKHVGGRKQWKILGLPLFKVRKMANGITTKYYLFGIPVLKVSRRQE